MNTLLGWCKDIVPKLNKSFPSLLIGASLVAGIAGCGGSSSSNAASTHSQSSPSASKASTGNQKSPVVIPTILSLTGGAAFLGQEQQEALTALAKQTNSAGGINGHPVSFKIYDNATSPKVAVQIASRLIAQHVPLLLNGSIGATATAVDTLVKPSGPLTFSLTPVVSPPAHSMIFAIGTSIQDEVDAEFNFLREKGWTKIAVLTSNDTSGATGWAAMQHALSLPENHGFQLLTHQTFDDTAVSVSAQITKMESPKPQVVVTWATGSPMEVVFKGLGNSSLKGVPVFANDGNQTYSQMDGWKSILPGQLYFPSAPFSALNVLSGSQKQAVQTFNQAFQGVTSQGKPVRPDIGQTLAWDPAELFIHILQKDGINASATQLKSTLENVQGYAGVNGVFKFSPTDHRGLGINDVYIAQWNAAQNTWLAVSGPAGALLKK